jgi:hypothetical protein
VAAFDEPPHHVCAHSAQTDHSQLHNALLVWPCGDRPRLQFNEIDNSPI